MVRDDGSDDGSDDMGADYIPEADALAVTWMSRFASILLVEWDTYHLTQQQAIDIDSAVQAFEAAHQVARASVTRCPPAIIVKNEARQAAEKLIRPAAQKIRIDVNIPAALKAAIGLKPPGARIGRIHPPASCPVLYFSGITLSGQITIRFYDSQSLKGRRPYGAVGLELYEQIDAADWRFIGLHTRSTIRINPAVSQPGQSASYKARWVTARGETGEFCNIRSIQPLCNAMLRLGDNLQATGRAAA
jgi:hypothetical protein